MASLEMQGPYKKTKNNVTNLVEQRKGNYALGYINDEKSFVVKYVGRSDSDIQERLLYWVENSDRTHFRFSYATSIKEAFEKECKNYHEFKNLDNDIHPDKPDNTDYECPYCN